MRRRSRAGLLIVHGGNAFRPKILPRGWMRLGSGRARGTSGIPDRGGRTRPPAQAGRELLVRLAQAIAVLLIRLDTPLQPLDRLVPSRQATEVIDGPVGGIAVL